MKRVLAVALLCLSLASCTPGTGVQSTNVAGNAPPSIDVLQKNLPQDRSQIHIVGLHKIRDGAYMVITDTPSSNYGGPYQLLRLESGEWMMSLQQTFGESYIKITP
jgi:hypothetical protein